MKVRFYKFPLSKVNTKKTGKTQIVIAGTNSGVSAYKIIDYYSKINHKVAPHYIIDRDGRVFQLFNTKFWTNFVGRVDTERKILGIDDDYNINTRIISIVLTNYGGLLKLGDKFITNNGKIFEGDINELDNEVRGYKYHVKYTDKQLYSLSNLLAYLSVKYNIPINKDFEKSFELNYDAINGKPGIYTKMAFSLTDVSIFPQKELLNAVYSANDKKNIYEKG